MEGKRGDAGVRRTALIILLAAALLVVVVSAQPRAWQIELSQPPSALPRLRADGLAYETLVWRKPWSTWVVVSNTRGYAVSWANDTSVFYFAPWSGRASVGSGSGTSGLISNLGVMYNFTRVLPAAFRASVSGTTDASGSRTLIIAVVANATTLGTLTSCSVGAQALGGVIVYCLTQSVSASSNYAFTTPWVTVNARTLVLSVANSAYTSTINTQAWLDISQKTVVPVSGTIIPANGSMPVYRIFANTSPANVPLFQFNPTNTYYSGGFVYCLFNLTASPLTRSSTFTFAKSYIASPQTPVNITHFSAGARTGTVQVTAASLIVDAVMPDWINVSTAQGWLRVDNPPVGATLNLASPPPRSQAMWVTFYVSDYGQGFTHLHVYSMDNRLAWRGAINTATQSVVALLVPYQNYIISVWKQGEERALGPLTVTQTQYYLTVPVPPPTWKPAPLTATVSYNGTAYIVSVNCRNPPCTVQLMKTMYVPPGQTLTSTMSIAPGDAIAPHLYDWYFDGLDDYIYVGVQPVNTGTPFTMYGWSGFTVLLHATLLSFSAFTSHRLWEFGLYDVPYPHMNMFTLSDLSKVVYAFRYSDLSSQFGTFTYDVPSAQCLNQRNWYATVFANASRVYQAFLNANLLVQSTAPRNMYTVVDVNPSSLSSSLRPPYQRVALSSAAKQPERYTRMLAHSFLIWSRPLAQSELQAAQSLTVNASGLRLFIDATFWNGSGYVNLAPYSYTIMAYNGVQRRPANATWLWLVKGLHGDGRVHLRFFPRGSVVVFTDAATNRVVAAVEVKSSDEPVALPAGTYVVNAVLGGYSYDVEKASFQCSQQICSIVWFTSDPYLNATVTDAAGYAYTVVTGTAQQAQSWLRGILSTAADELNLQRLGGAQFLILALTLLIFIMLSSAYEWRTGAIAAVIFNTAMQAWTGFSVLNATVSSVLIAMVVLDLVADYL